MPAEIIGACKCPVCSSPKASLRLSAKQLAYVHCNACHIQCFARSDLSDSKLRALRVDQAEAPANDATKAPTPLAELTTKAARAASSAPAPRPSSWGMLR